MKKVVSHLNYMLNNITANGYALAHPKGLVCGFTIKKSIKEKPQIADQCGVTSSRDYLAEMLLRRTKEKKKKCEAGLLKNFCQFQTTNNNTNG